jgi:hypothetical protein
MLNTLPGAGVGRGWRRIFLALFVSFALMGGSIASLAAAGVPAKARRPVIIIPGLMGSVLETQGSHHQIWGHYMDITFASPHQGLVDPKHDGLELPTSSTDFTENRDSLLPIGILERMTVVPHVLSVPVYARWLKILSRAGYQTGDINNPRSGDNCFVFYYDWRRDLVESAQLLAERIDAIRAAQGTATNLEC